MIIIRADEKYCRAPNMEADCNKVALDWENKITCEQYYNRLKKDGDKILRCDQCLAGDRGELVEE